MAATVWELNGDKQVVSVRSVCIGVLRPFVLAVFTVSQAENSSNSKSFAGWWHGREVRI